MTREEFCFLFPDWEADSASVLYASSAVDFLREKTTIQTAQLYNLPAKAKLFIRKYIEMFERNLTVTSENMAGMSQSFRTDSLDDAIRDLAAGLLGDSYCGGCSFSPGVRRWQ